MNGEPWEKSNQNPEMDVTMGGKDGAETCEFVGLYILYKIQLPKVTPGLYRDNGLMFSTMTRRQKKMFKKQIVKILKEIGFDITIETNLTTIDFLDVTLNLNEQSYKPYCKPNNTIHYIHKNSNHPPIISNYVSKVIETRLSTISSSKEIFDDSKQPYQDALRHSVS